MYIEKCGNCGLDVTNNMSHNCFGCVTTLVDNIPVRMPNPQHPSYKKNLAKLDKALKTGKNVSLAFATAFPADIRLFRD